MGTRRPALPGGARRHAKRAGNVGSIWPCPEGIRERGGGGGGLSKIDRHRPRLRRCVSATRACPEDPGTDRRRGWRPPLIVCPRPRPAAIGGRNDCARLDGEADRTGAAPYAG